MAELTDKEVILKIKNGEIDFFSLLVERYTRIIFAYVRGKISAQEDAEDLVQNTFINFYKAIDRFDISRKVLPYLYEIAKNEMRMFFRAKKKTVSLDENIGVGASETSLATETQMEDVLQYLSEREKNTLKLLQEGYSYEEISEKMGLRLNTIRTVIRRARLKLNKLDNYG